MGLLLRGSGHEDTDGRVVRDRLDVSSPPGSVAQPAASPDQDLPPHITRLTLFGERADFSHDGKRVLFVEKTFGDVYEVEINTRIPRLLTGFYPHHGYTRALYLANGDILLSGPAKLDPSTPATPACSASCRSLARTLPAARPPLARSARRVRPSRENACTSPGRTSPPSIPTRCPREARGSSRPTSWRTAALLVWPIAGWSSRAGISRSAARSRPRISARPTSAS